MFTFARLCGTIRLLRRFGMELFTGGKRWQTFPIVLIVEDDPSIQSIVEDALKEGGFETAIASSAEEAVTLIKGRVMNYRAAGHGHQPEGPYDRVGGRETGPTDRTGVSHHLHDGCWC
jgi:hypothetical protein